MKLYFQIKFLCLSEKSEWFSGSLWRRLILLVNCNCEIPHQIVSKEPESNGDHFCVIFIHNYKQNTFITSLFCLVPNSAAWISCHLNGDIEIGRTAALCHVPNMYQVSNWCPRCIWPGHCPSGSLPNSILVSLTKPALCGLLKILVWYFWIWSDFNNFLSLLCILTAHLLKLCL